MPIRCLWVWVIISMTYQFSLCRVCICRGLAGTPTHCNTSTGIITTTRHGTVKIGTAEYSSRFLKPHFSTYNTRQDNDTRSSKIWLYGTQSSLVHLYTCSRVVHNAQDAVGATDEEWCNNLKALEKIAVYPEKSLMAKGLSQWRLRDKNCTVYDLKVMGSNPSQVKLWVRTTFVYLKSKNNLWIEIQYE